MADVKTVLDAEIGDIYDFGDMKYVKITEEISVPIFHTLEDLVEWLKKGDEEIH